MPMPRRNPPFWGELAHLQERLHQLIEQALVGVGEDLQGEGAAGCWRPTLDLVETEDAFLVHAELPGVLRQDVELEVEGQWLELAGERHMPGGERGFLRLEGSYGRFRRRLELPAAVDPDGVAAELRRGVLKVRLPKRRPAAGSRVEIEDER
jgi:HSP20 family protein